MKRVNEGEILVLPRSQTTADVFVGVGWDNHSVFELVEGKPALIKGPSLSEVQFRFVRKMMVS